MTAARKRAAANHRHEKACGAARRDGQTNHYTQECNVSNDEQIEQEIQNKGLTAPRVTPADVENEIALEISFNVGAAGRALGVPHSAGCELLTICVLTLKNGFTVTGESACASPENFNAEIGHKIARQHAVDKIWPLLGFRLRDQLDTPERG